MRLKTLIRRLESAGRAYRVWRDEDPTLFPRHFVALRAARCYPRPDGRLESEVGEYAFVKNNAAHTAVYRVGEDGLPEEQTSVRLVCRHYWQALDEAGLGGSPHSRLSWREVASSAGEACKRA